MERDELLNLAKAVLSLPTAPYHEQHVRDFVVRFCRDRGLRVESDRVGNVIAEYRSRTRGVPAAPLVFVAHMDHPGFEMLGGKRAEFLGGVPKELFAGARIRGFTSDGVKRARILRLVATEWPRRKIVELEVRVNFRKGEFAMWDVPVFAVRNGVLRAAAIDDVLGCVVTLATLAEVSRRKMRTNVWGVFTRAEEVGFGGALALIRSGRISKKALVVSIEMSRERPWARIGNGPIVRVGDRTTVFDPLVTSFLFDAAAWGRKGGKFRIDRVQRCLMDGGSCEATAFAGFGYQAGGLCLPLGNYHNIGSNGKPQAEYVSVSDLEQLVELMVAAARQAPQFSRNRVKLKTKLLDISRNAPRKLTKI